MTSPLSATSGLSTAGVAAPSSPLPARIGFVVIGRNEGQRLRLCLLSVAGRGRPVVYVDSGSTDGSAALARSMAAGVVELDRSRPFSAARARNEGVNHLLRIGTDLEFVQFVDGDCEMIDGWLEHAGEALRRDLGVVVVCGRLREQFPERSIYNRLADLEWETPVGEASAFGGIAMMRVAPFLAVGGFDPTLTAGEEPELCGRIRRAGGRVVRLDVDMAWHDQAITQFRQWWRRAVRCGYACRDIATRSRRGEPGPFARQLHAARLWAVGWPLTVLAGGCAGWRFGGPTAGLATVGLFALVLPAQVLRIAVKVRPRVRGPREAIAYGWLMMASKWANLAGQLCHIHDRFRGSHARLFDYKATAAVGPVRLAEKGPS